MRIQNAIDLTIDHQVGVGWIPKAEVVTLSVHVGLAIRQHECPAHTSQGVCLGDWVPALPRPYLGRDGSRVVLKEEALETANPQPFLFLVLGLGVR